MAEEGSKICINFVLELKNEKMPIESLIKLEPQRFYYESNQMNYRNRQVKVEVKEEVKVEEESPEIEMQSRASENAENQEENSNEEELGPLETNIKVEPQRFQSASSQTTRRVPFVKVYDFLQPHVALSHSTQAEIDQWTATKKKWQEMPESELKVKRIIRKNVRKRSGEKQAVLQHKGPFTCDVCGKIFKNRDSLRHHLHYQHFKPRLFLCDFCPKSFTLKSRLEKHARSHRSYPKATNHKGSFTCDVCGNFTKSRESLLNHLFYQHFKTLIFFCDLCPKSFATKSKLKQHMEKHRAYNSHTCNICGFKPKRKESLNAHLLTHNKKTKCPICHKLVAIVKRHIRDAHTESKCEICGRIVRARCAKRHFRHVHKKKKKCSQCGEEKFSKYELNQHVIKTHFEGKLFERQSSTVFKRKGQLKLHQESHKHSKGSSTNCIGENPKELPIASVAKFKPQKKPSAIVAQWKATRKFYRRIKASRHLPLYTGPKLNDLRKRPMIPRLNHKGPYTCDICGGLEKNRHSMYDHMKYLHLIAPYLFCDLCPSSFSKKGNLELHMRSHVSFKACKCDVCGIRLKNSVTLRIHKLRHEPKTECPICNKLVTSVKMHSIAHKVKIKVSCPICGKKISKLFMPKHLEKAHSKNCDQCRESFNTFKELRGHTLKAHNNVEKFYDCQICDRTFKNARSLKNHIKTRHIA